MNSATYVGCTRCEIEPEHYCKWWNIVMFISNAAVILAAVLTGVLRR